MIYWLLKHLFAGPLLKSTFRPWVTGAEHVPRKGAVILASNHLSVIDSVFLPLVLERRVTFLAKKEYFTGKGLKGWITRQFFLATGMLPIDRSGGAASEASLRTGLEVLGQGNALGIYPEGTRSPDGRMYRGRTGIARMVMELDAKVPVVPVVMVDTEKVMPIGTTIPRVRRIGIAIGEPIDFSRYSGLDHDRFLLRAITDEVMTELDALGNQEYVDKYASSIRAKMDAERAAAQKAR